MKAAINIVVRLLGISRQSCEIYTEEGRLPDIFLINRLFNITRSTKKGGLVR